MTFSAPTDYYDDGLVHAHAWSRTTPPGQHHKEGSHGSKPSSDHDKPRD